MNMVYFISNAHLNKTILVELCGVQKMSPQHWRGAPKYLESYKKEESIEDEENKTEGTERRISLTYQQQ